MSECPNCGDDMDGIHAEQMAANGDRCVRAEWSRVTDEVAALRAELATRVQQGIDDHERAERAGAERDDADAAKRANLAAAARLAAEVERIQSELDALQVKYTDVCFENERMRGVVEAACAHRDIEDRHYASLTEGDKILNASVDAYRAASSEQETSDLTPSDEWMEGYRAGLGERVDPITATSHAAGPNEHAIDEPRSVTRRRAIQESDDA